MTERKNHARTMDCSYALFWRTLSIMGMLLAAQANADVSVRDGELIHDGRPWVAKGIVQIAFVAPPAAQQGVFVDAYQHYSPSDYAAMRDHGIDAVRIQISQPGLDPQNPLFTTDFRSRVIDAVYQARAAGLVVMLSVQDEAQSGETHVARLPNDATRRVWQSLAPVFANDRDVMYELLNEPNLPPTPENWQLWRDAMNATLDVVRSSGARNVAVADGLMFAERLEGAPDLLDPLGQVAYASHPYAHDAAGQRRESWNMKFGDFARRHPVIVTEWTTVPSYFCDSDTARYAHEFLRYLTRRRIGLMAYAWDFSGSKFGSAFHGFPAQPTTFDEKTCGEPDFGPGALIERLYHGEGRQFSPPIGQAPFPENRE